MVGTILDREQTEYLQSIGIHPSYIPTIERSTVIRKKGLDAKQALGTIYFLVTTLVCIYMIATDGEPTLFWPIGAIFSGIMMGGYLWMIIRRKRDRKSAIIVTEDVLVLANRQCHSMWTWEYLMDKKINLHHMNDGLWYVEMFDGDMLIELFDISDFDVKPLDLKKEIDQYHPPVMFRKGFGQFMFGWRKYKRANQGIYD